MMFELVYTSVPQGLKPGTAGFCVVAMSRNMHPLLVQHLERMSGYRHLNPPGSSNPVTKSFSCISIQGKSYFVLSRIADAGLDYSSRSNHIAHHIVVEPTPQHSAGPAYYLGRDDLFCGHWTGQPRFLSPRELPAVQVNPKPCVRWQSITGDAGWASEPIEAVLKGKTCTTIVLPHVDSLSLVAESLALLPASERWKTTFSTYYTKPAAGTDFQWRFVIQETAEALAHETNFNALIDLTKRLGPARGRLSDDARNGRALSIGGSKHERTNLTNETPVGKSTESSLTASGIARVRSADRSRVESNSLVSSEPPKYPLLNSEMARSNTPSRTAAKSTRWVVATVFAMGIALGGIIVAFVLMSGQPTGTNQISDKTATNASEVEPQPKNPPGTDSNPPKEKELPRDKNPNDAESKLNGTELPTTETPKPANNGNADSQPNSKEQPSSPPKEKPSNANELAKLSEKFKHVNSEIQILDLENEKEDTWERKLGDFTSSELLELELEIEIHNPLANMFHYTLKPLEKELGYTSWEIMCQRKDPQGKLTGDDELLGWIGFYDAPTIKWAWNDDDKEKEDVAEGFKFCKMEFSHKSPIGSVEQANPGLSFTVAFRKPNEVNLMDLLRDGFEWTPPKALADVLYEKLDFETSSAIVELPIQHLYTASRPSPTDITDGVKPKHTQLKKRKDADEIYDMRRLSQLISERWVQKVSIEYKLEKSLDKKENVITIKLQPKLKIWCRNPIDLEADICEPDPFDEASPNDTAINTSRFSNKLMNKFSNELMKSVEVKAQVARILDLNLNPNHKLPKIGSDLIKSSAEELCNHFCEQIDDHHKNWKCDFVLKQNEIVVPVIHVVKRPNDGEDIPPK